MTPLVRATWAPCGVTPKLEQVMGERKKVSAIAALCVRPDGRRVRLYLAFFPEDNIDGELVQAFVGTLLRHLDGPVVLLWDGLDAHEAEETQEFLEAHPRLRVYSFAAYCPELNPVEEVWRWLKWDKLANFAPENIVVLEAKIEELGAQACSCQDLIRSFIAQSELPLELDWG